MSAGAEPTPAGIRSGSGSSPTHSSDEADVHARSNWPWNPLDGGNGTVTSVLLIARNLPAVVGGRLVVDHDLTRRALVIGYALSVLYGTPGAAAANATGASGAAVETAPMPEGISSESSGLQATELVVRSVDQGFITDAAGRRLGAGDVDTATDVPVIPGGIHETADDSDQYVLSESGAYVGSWEVASTGEVEFLARTHDGETTHVAGATGPFTVPAGARLRVAFALPFGQDTVVEVDVNGDGRVNRRVPFGRGTDAMDETPPIARARVIQRTFDGTDWWAEVEVEASDDGAGVARIDAARDVGEVVDTVAPGRCACPPTVNCTCERSTVPATSRPRTRWSCWTMRPARPGGSRTSCPCRRSGGRAAWSSRVTSTSGAWTWPRPARTGSGSSQGGSTTATGAGPGTVSRSRSPRTQHRC